MKPMQTIWNPDHQEAVVDWGDDEYSSYKLVGSEPYTTKAGEQTTLRVWKSMCATCGIEYIVKTSAKVTEKETMFYRRNCDAHKAAPFGKP